MGTGVASIILATFLALAAVSAEREVLTNEDILVMTEAGLSERVIVAKIMASETDFDISRKQLVELARAGVEASVLETMVVKTVPSAARPTPGPYAQRFEGTPCAAPGLYVESEEETLVRIDPQTPQIRGGNSVLTGITWGIFPARTKAAVRGARSDTRTSGRVPTFWFCPEEMEFPADPRMATDPLEYLLVVLKSSETREERSVDVGSANAWGGRTGIPSRLLRRTRFEDMGFGVYRITPRSPLEPGEYGFYHTGGPGAATGLFGGAKVYGFGVDGI